MRAAGLALVLAAAAGCADLRDLAARGPVDAAAPPQSVPAAVVRYTSRDCTPLPVAPLQAFGVRYALDLVMRPARGPYDLHEVALLVSPDAARWIAKDADVALVQRLVTPDPALAGAWPEVPLARRVAPVRVVATPWRRGQRLDAAWTTHEGVAVTASWGLAGPLRPRARRNTSTMGHSADAVLAVLDLSHSRLAVRPRLTYDGDPVPVRWVLGLAPFAAAIAQVQGGLSAGDWRVGGTVGVQEGSGLVETVPQAGARESWTWTVLGDAAHLRTEDPLRRREARFQRGADGAWELAALTVQPAGDDLPAVVVRFEPPLPDVRRRFEGEEVRRFVVDVGGQRGHAVGRVLARWEGDTAVLDVLPTAPAWTVDRALRAEVRCDDRGATVSVRRTP